MLRGEGTNTIVFGRTELEPTTDRYQDDHANHYTTDAVYGINTIRITLGDLVLSHIILVTNIRCLWTKTNPLPFALLCFITQTSKSLKYHSNHTTQLIFLHIYKIVILHDIISVSYTSHVIFTWKTDP